MWKDLTSLPKAWHVLLEKQETAFMGLFFKSYIIKDYHFVQIHVNTKHFIRICYNISWHFFHMVLARIQGAAATLGGATGSLPARAPTDHWILSIPSPFRCAFHTCRFWAEISLNMFAYAQTHRHNNNNNNNGNNAHTHTQKQRCVCVCVDICPNLLGLRDGTLPSHAHTHTHIYTVGMLANKTKIS